MRNNEVRTMLASFAGREGVHQRAYALLNATLGLPESEFHAFLEYSEMADKLDFMANNNITSHTGLALALAQSVFNEGMSLFASFVMLLNFQRFGKMKGMGTIVEWSIRDETLHVQGNAKLFRTFCEEHPRIVNDELKSKIHDHRLDKDLYYEENGETIELVAIENALGEECYVVKREDGKGKSSTEFYSTNSGLLIQNISQQESEKDKEPATSTVQFSDYKDIDGFKYPSKLTMDINGNPMEINVSKMDLNCKLKKSEFSWED